MKIKIVLCEGLRDSRLVQAVLEYYTDFRPVTDDKRKKVEKRLEELIKNLIGRIEDIYGKENDYVVILNMQSEFSKFLSDKSLLEAYKDLELEENVELIFVFDSEYSKLKDHFKSCLIFNNRIEDFIINIVHNLDVDVDTNITNDLLKYCQKYNNKINEDKFKVQLYHLILSAGKCDKVMFVKLFKLLEEKNLEKPKEILDLINLLTS